MNYIRSILGTPILFSGIAFADTLHIKPGQCVMVGSQQVCALTCDNQTTGFVTPAPTPKIIVKSVCKFGAEQDEGGKVMKGYGHYVIRIKEDGSKVENLLENFGPAGKAECQKAAKNYHEN